MGFAPVASAAVLLVAAFQIVGYAIPDAMEHQERADAALEAAWDRQAFADDAAVDIVSVSSSSGNVSIVARNTGDATLSARTLLAVLDGTPVTPNAWAIDGATSDVWAPGQEANFTVSAPAPTNVALALRTGHVEFWGA